MHEAAQIQIRIMPDHKLLMMDEGRRRWFDSLPLQRRIWSQSSLVRSTQFRKIDIVTVDDILRFNGLVGEITRMRCNWQSLRAAARHIRF